MRVVFIRRQHMLEEIYRNLQYFRLTQDDTIIILTRIFRAVADGAQLQANENIISNEIFANENNTIH